nr:DUF6358 family protein [uncultured Pedobacter sp.]
MGKHIIFSVILNVLIIGSAAVGYYGYKAGNYYFIPLLCAAAFGLSIYYKIKHTKFVQQEMKKKAEANVNKKSNKR